MKGNVPVLILGLTAILSTGLTARVQARDASAPNLATPEAVQSFRQNFNLALDNMQVVFERTRSSKGRQLVADAKQRMQNVTDEDIARTFARGGVPDLLQFVTATRKLTGAIDRSGTRPMGQAGDFTTPQSSPFPGSPGILGECGSILHSSGFTFGALVAQQIARAIIEAAQFACEEVVVILGEGGNGSAVCIPLAIAADAAAIPYELASFCGGEEDSAVLQGSYDRLEHIHGDLDAARNQILANDNSNLNQILNNDNSNTTTILNNTNANTTQIINNSNSNTDNILAAIGANADLAESHEIEMNLANDSCPAWIYTPEYADTAHTIRLGGRFEKVVTVVQHVIDNARALQSVRRFNLEFAQAALNFAVFKVDRRPPFRSDLICDLLLAAYQKVTPTVLDRDHGHLGFGH
jgi:hypothetical protein